MKTKNLIRVMLIIFISTTTFTSKVFGKHKEDNRKGTSTMEVNAKDGQAGLYILSYYSDNSSKVAINIYSSDEELIMSEVIRDHRTFQRPYNFNALPYGRYTIEVEDAYGKKTDIIEHYGVNNKAKKGKTFVNLDYVKGEDRKLILTMVNWKKEPISVKIYDAEDRLLHEEDEIFKGGFSKIYNLDEVESDTFVFEISDEEGIVKRIVR